MLAFRLPQLPGLNDGTIYPPSDFPLGTSTRSIRRAAAERAPLRGTIRVLIVLVDFPDKELTESADHFRSLFFSTGELPQGSVKEYYTEVTNGLIEIAGDVVGPYRMPRNMTEYGHGKSAMLEEEPNGQTLALDAAKAANADVDFGPYDNDGNGMVDAFIVLHAGPGAEVTLDGGDIWSHKWVLPGDGLDADGTRIFAYLTIPEDCKIGVCAHELGHLLFGWPDLYDTDDSSAGLGDWCLMAGGSWNGDGGDVPAHPSAWCKAEQGWVTVQNQTGKQTVDVKDVKDDFTVYRLWKEGEDSQEYFLVENRQKTGYDTELPSDGLFVYHIDDALDSNSDESHYKVGLVQADDQRDLERNANQGDSGDPYPGSSANRELTGASMPDTNAFSGAATGVAITSIGDSGASMSVEFDVGESEPPPVDPELRRGDQGADVERLQQALLNLGFDPGPIDGDFQGQTEDAVRAYQKARCLNIDGIVGACTWARIHADGE
jgi:immune inhibitor A